MVRLEREVARLKEEERGKPLSKGARGNTPRRVVSSSK